MMYRHQKQTMLLLLMGSSPSISNLVLELRYLGMHLLHVLYGD